MASYLVKHRDNLTYLHSRIMTQAILIKKLKLYCWISIGISKISVWKTRKKYENIKRNQNKSYRIDFFDDIKNNFYFSLPASLKKGNNENW